MCKRTCTTVLVLLTVIANAHAQSPTNSSPTAPASQTAKPPTPPPSGYDKAWATFTNWYTDDSNPVVQRVVFTGRFHHDLATVRADEGDHDESNIRRVRLGPRITFAKKFLFHMEVEVNPQERDPFYLRLTDLYVQWNRSPRFALTVGKQSIPFTQEGATSSRELLTIDRSNLANNIWFGQEYMPGVSVSGTTAPWNYRVGVYSAGAMNRELGNFSGGVFTLAVLGYDFAKQLGVRQAVLTGNYLYQDPDVDNTFTRRFEHIGSVHFRLEEPKWGLRTDLSPTKGYLGQSNLWAIMAMPYTTPPTNCSSSRASRRCKARIRMECRYRHMRVVSCVVVATATTSGIGQQLLHLRASVETSSRTRLCGSGRHGQRHGHYAGYGFTAGLRVGW